MCIYGKLGAKKTLIADYQNTKQFWENKSILREQFNFENKSWERLLEDLQSNVLRMLVKNITYIELIGVEFVSKLKSGRIVSDIPLPSDSRTIYLNLPIQRRLASRRDIDLCHDHSVYKYVSELNFSSTSFRRELDENDKFKWIWGELVLFLYLRRTGTGRADVWWNISKSSPKLFHEKAAEVLQLKGNTLNEVLVQNSFMIMARKPLKNV